MELLERVFRYKENFTKGLLWTIQAVKEASSQALVGNRPNLILKKVIFVVWGGGKD